MGEITFKQIGAALEPVEDPEIHIGICDLGLVYGAEIADTGAVTVKMSLTSPACPYGPLIIEAAKAAVRQIPGVNEAKVDLTFDPVWDPRTMADEDTKDELGIE